MSSNKKSILLFFKIVIAFIVLIGVIVFVFDPFYHYHKPWLGLKAVLNDKEYQVVGTLKHFDYDALLVGSSVMENNDNSWYDEAYDCTSIKAIRSYGATADLCYFLDIAYNSGNDIKYIFYNIDPSALYADSETTFESSGCPMYLYDDNPFNDLQYLYNKDVLFEKIPYMIVNSLMSDYNEGLSYNWAKWKTFNSATALGLYSRTKEVTEMMAEDVYQEQLDANIAMLTEQVEAHPETQFTFFFPAYSMLWWDGIYRTGERDAIIYNERQAVKTLLEYDNVRIFCFQYDEEVVTNLENYMDSIHFSQDINRWQLDEILAGEYEMTPENYNDMLDELYEFTEKVQSDYIIPYEEQDLLNYEE